MAHALPDTKAILALLTLPGAEEGLTARQMAERLGLPPRLRATLRRKLQSLCREGELVPLRGRKFGARRVLGDVAGKFTRLPAGFGFVVPDDPEQTDLFIPPGAQAGALHGDWVAARVVEVRADGRREGRIEKILERRSPVVSGLYQGTLGGGGVVAPLDAGFGFEILVPREQGGGAQAGEIVRVALETFPRDGGMVRGRVVERLGRPDAPGVDVQVLIHKYGFSPLFPAEVEEEVARLPEDPSAWPTAFREDFTGSCVVTIDGETAQDFDDAIEVRRLDGGGYRLVVHIADVAFFVPEGSATDAEAVRRGTSVYFPGRAVPMLPEKLSHHLCSLRPAALRLTQGVTLDYDAGGGLRSARFHEGVIRSAARLTYTEVARIVEDRDAEARAGMSREIVAMLDAAAELALRLAERRAARGAIDFDLPEPLILIELTGQTTDIVARRRNLAHRMIEEFMIAANQAVATELKRARVPALYRVHERPDPQRVGALAEMLAGLGYRLPENHGAVRPRDFAALIEAARGAPEEAFVGRAVLRTMALARYAESCDGHFGLALTRYLHFTSPIRRYPDLVAHRALRRWLRGPAETPGERADRAARLPELARECSRLERDAEAAERESIAWKVAAFMAERLGEEFEGRIADLAPHGLTVALEDPYVEGLVPVSRLGPEYFRFDAQKRALRGAQSGRAFRLGQPLRVRVDRVDLFRHFVDFALAGEAAPPPRRKTREPRTPPRGAGRTREGRGPGRGRRRESRSKR